MFCAAAFERIAATSRKNVAAAWFAIAIVSVQYNTCFFCPKKTVGSELKLYMKM